jgi:hypothetical protein
MTWVLTGASVVVVAAVIGGVVVLSGADHTTSAAQEPAANTATVEKGSLSAMVSQIGTLTFRAQSDGSPYAVINQAGGTYTKLPDAGDKVDCGHALHRVDDNPVLPLCGSTPAYRSLSKGDRGPDVAELNANLVDLGYATRARLDPSSDSFTPETASALERRPPASAAEAWSGGIASAILIGAFAGLMPAVRASRMLPTVALRTV